MHGAGRTNTSGKSMPRVPPCTGHPTLPDPFVSPHRHPRSEADRPAHTELLDAPGGAVLRLQFRGPFEGRTVTWQATLQALMAPTLAGTPPAPSRAFIDIGEDTPTGVPITIGLPVPAIDLPTIQKTLIMIRRYKRLRRGRLDYGAVR